MIQNSYLIVLSESEKLDIATALAYYRDTKLDQQESKDQHTRLVDRINRIEANTTPWLHGLQIQRKYEPTRYVLLPSGNDRERHADHLVLAFLTTELHHAIHSEQPAKRTAIIDALAQFTSGLLTRSEAIARAGYAEQFSLRDVSPHDITWHGQRTPDLEP